MSIVSGNGDVGFLSECRGKISVDEFKTCILQKSTSFIRNISLVSYKQAAFLSEITSAQIVIPEDGSVGLKQDLFKPTFHLDPLFTYMICLFDKDFLLSVSNPLIVTRNCAPVSANSTFAGITIKVGMFRGK